MSRINKFLMLLLLFSGATLLHGQRGQTVEYTHGTTPWYADAGLAYGDDVEEFGLRLGGGYDLPNIQRLRLAGNFIWYFADSPVDWYTISAYAQYSIIQGQVFDVYALAGGIYSRKKFDNPVFGSQSKSDIGFLFGGGGEFHIMDNASLYTELTASTGDLDQLVWSLGVRYFF